MIRPIRQRTKCVRPCFVPCRVSRLRSRGSKKSKEIDAGGEVHYRKESNTVMRISIVISAGILAVLLPTELAAMPILVEVQKVPTARLLTNLTRRVQANPQDAELHYALGRVYCWSYAQNLSEFNVRKDK